MRQDIEIYVKAYNVCLASKAVWHKPYENLQTLPVPTYRWKDLSIDFLMGLPVSTDWKSKSCDLILVIIDRLTMTIHYKLVKITIDTSGLAKVIIDVVVWYQGLPDSIITN